MTATPSSALADAQPQAGRSLGWWGVVVLTMTEGMLFALLLFTYFYLWSQAPEWPLGGIADPELRTSGARTVLLVASSATYAWAERALRLGRQRRFRAGLAVTFLLAAVFLAGHVEETARLLGEFSWRTNAYGSLWYVITNFHAAHLSVGLVMVAFIAAVAARGMYDAGHHIGVTVTGIYWHFVDVVWVVVYASLYLGPVLT